MASVTMVHRWYGSFLSLVLSVRTDYSDHGATLTAWWKCVMVTVAQSLRRMTTICTLRVNMTVNAKDTVTCAWRQLQQSRGRGIMTHGIRATWDHLSVWNSDKTDSTAVTQIHNTRSYERCTASHIELSSLLDWHNVRHFCVSHISRTLLFRRNDKVILPVSNFSGGLPIKWVACTSIMQKGTRYQNAALGVDFQMRRHNIIADIARWSIPEINVYNSP
jgi:hypothetical protein